MFCLPLKTLIHISLAVVLSLLFSVLASFVRLLLLILLRIPRKKRTTRTIIGNLFVRCSSPPGQMIFHQKSSNRCISDNSCDGGHDKDDMDNHKHNHTALDIAGTVFIAASVDGSFVARENGDILWPSPPPVDDNVNANANDINMKMARRNRMQKMTWVSHLYWIQSTASSWAG